MSTATSFPTCPTSLTEEQVARFHRDGYLAFHDVLSEEEVEGTKAALTAIVDQLRESHRTLKNAYGRVWRMSDSPLAIQFESGYEPDSDEDPDAELKVRKYHDFVGTDELLTHLATTHPKIQGILSQLLSPDPLLMQNMALVKPPFYGTEKPWHQDEAYFRITPVGSVCGVWIAIDEAAAENGCMHVLPGAHHLGALRHYHGIDCEIVPDRMESGVASLANAVPVELPPGGALFFSGVLPHQTPPNTSPDRRRALQFHYRTKESRLATEEEYDAEFVEADGTPASCSAAARRGL